MSNKLVYHARNLLENKEDFIVSKVVETTGSTPRKKGAWMITTKEGQHYGTVGGGKIEAVAQEIALETFHTKEASKVHHFVLRTEEKNALDMGCGGEASILVNYIKGDDSGEFIKEFGLDSHVYIFGGGHVGLALEPLLRHVGFFTSVLDDRKDFANRERFKEAGEVKVIEDLDNSFKGITCNENSFIVIVTRGHQGDYQVLREALKQENCYIGMIGSKTKNKMIFDMLKKDGFTEEELSKVYAPIGENIHAETPEEIGVSITAEMIKVRAGYGER